MSANGSDPVLHALALVELVAKLGSADPLAEYCALAGAECEHQTVALFLADLIVDIAGETGFALQPFIDDQRTAALEPDEPPAGIA